MNTEHTITATISDYTNATGALSAQQIDATGEPTGEYLIEASIRLLDLRDGNIEVSILNSDLTVQRSDIIPASHLYAWLVSTC